MQPPGHGEYLEALDKWESPIKVPKKKAVTRNPWGLPMISKSV